MNRFIFFLAITILALHCNKEDISNGDDDILPTEEEQKIIQECIKNGLSSESEISVNLRGEWRQIGYGCGFCAPHDEPTSSIKFNQDQGVLTIEDDFEGKQTITFSWSIIKDTDIFGEPVFKLSTEPPHYALYMDTFCKKYMAFDHTPVDGHMFLYKKK